MDRRRADDRRRRDGETRIGHEVAHCIDAEHLEERGGKPDRQPEDPGEERRLGERESAAPSQVEEQRVGACPTTAGEAQLEQRHRQDPGEEQRQHESGDHLARITAFRRREMRRAVQGARDPDEQAAEGDGRLQQALAEERPQQLQRDGQHRGDQREGQHGPWVGRRPMLRSGGLVERPEQQSLRERESGRGVGPSRRRWQVRRSGRFHAGILPEIPKATDVRGGCGCCCLDATMLRVSAPLGDRLPQRCRMGYPPRVEGPSVA